MSIQYKLKPVVVDAVQWTGDNEKELNDFGVYGNVEDVPVGTYFVKASEDEFAVYEKDAFHKNFERNNVWDENL